MNKHNLNKNRYMLKGDLAHTGYDKWFHSFTGTNKVTGEKRTFFIEYYITNPQRGREYPVFTNLEDNLKPSYMMIRAGYWGDNGKILSRYMGINEYDSSPTMLKISTKDCFLSENNIWGHIAVAASDISEHPYYYKDEGNMSWSLRINKLVPYNAGYGTSYLVRLINIITMNWYCEGIKAAYSGYVKIDGDTYDVEASASYGYADKIWGFDFTSPFIHMGCNNLKSTITGKALNNSALALCGGSASILGVKLLNKLVLDFYYEGDNYEFNFSKIWTDSHGRYKCYETKDTVVWKVKAVNSGALIEIVAACKKKDMHITGYESPTGIRKLKKLWNAGTATVQIKLYKLVNGKRILVDEMRGHNALCEYGEHDSSFTK